MINVCIPAMGKSTFFSESYFPKLMVEIDGTTMLEKVVNDYSSIQEKHFVFMFDDSDCKKFHIDESAKIVTACKTDILQLMNNTAGALCTCLMGVEYIGDDNELIIANSDQIINEDYNNVIEFFRDNNADAGVITFESVHPRWSYVRVRGNEVIETAEKRPLSKHAIAGFYYFKNGNDFINAAKNAIKKDSRVDGKFYISSALNELILMRKKVLFYEIDKSKYHSFYSPEKIKEYEISIKRTV